MTICGQWCWLLTAHLDFCEWKFLAREGSVLIGSVRVNDLSAELGLEHCLLFKLSALFVMSHFLSRAECSESTPEMENNQQVPFFVWLVKDRSPSRSVVQFAHCIDIVFFSLVANKHSVGRHFKTKFPLDLTPLMIFMWPNVYHNGCKKRIFLFWHSLHTY